MSSTKASWSVLSSSVTAAIVTVHNFQNSLPTWQVTKLSVSSTRFNWADLGDFEMIVLANLLSKYQHRPFKKKTLGGRPLKGQTVI